MVPRTYEIGTIFKISIDNSIQQYWVTSNKQPLQPIRAQHWVQIPVKTEHSIAYIYLTCTYLPLLCIFFFYFRLDTTGGISLQTLWKSVSNYPNYEKIPFFVCHQWKRWDGIPPVLIVIALFHSILMRFARNGNILNSYLDEFQQFVPKLCKNSVL